MRSHLGGLAYSLLILGLATIGTLNALTGIVPDAALGGAASPVPAPRFSVQALFSGTFQEGATAWFEHQWGLRGAAIRTDNSVNLAVFRETRVGQPVVRMTGDVLVSHEDVGFYNLVGSPDEAVRYTRAIVRLQERLRKRKQLLLPVIMPSKTSVWRGVIPSRWQRAGVAGRSDETHYGAMVRVFEDEKATFVDGRALLTRDLVDPERVFPKTGRHLRDPAACRVLQAILDAARPETGLGDERLDCRYHLSTTTLGDTRDLFNLLNVWEGSDVAGDAFVGIPSEHALDLPTLFVGSSFVYGLLHAKRHTRCLEPSLFYYYDASKVNGETEEPLGKVEPFTEIWRRETFSRPLIVLELLETYNPWQHRQFLGEMERALDAEDGARVDPGIDP